MTRRQLALTLAAQGALATAAAAQAPPPSTPPAPPQTPEEFLARAKERIKRTSEALHKIDIDISLEPASRFEVL